MVVLEYEDAVGDEASKGTVVVVLDVSEVLDPSSPHSFQPDQSPRIGSYLGKISRLLSSGLPSLGEDERANTSVHLFSMLLSSNFNRHPSARILPLSFLGLKFRLLVFELDRQPLEPGGCCGGVNPVWTISIKPVVPVVSVVDVDLQTFRVNCGIAGPCQVEGSVDVD